MYINHDAELSIATIHHTIDKEIYCELYESNIEPELDCTNCPHYEGQEYTDNHKLIIYCNYDIELEEES